MDDFGASVIHKSGDVTLFIKSVDRVRPKAKASVGDETSVTGIVQPAMQSEQGPASHWRLLVSSDLDRTTNAKTIAGVVS